MKKVNLLIVFICMSAIFINNVSCKKDGQISSQPPTAHYKFPPEGLKYIQLAAGKYFIYKDSANGSLDSVKVTKSELIEAYSPSQVSSSIFSPDIPAYYYNVYMLDLTKFNGTVQSDWMLGVANNKADATGFGMIAQDTSVVFMYPYNPVFPSLQVEDSTYTDIIRTEDWNGFDISRPEYRKTIFYWAKQVGIVKRQKVTQNGNVKTYILLRHN